MAGSMYGRTHLGEFQLEPIQRLRGKLQFHLIEVTKKLSKGMKHLRQVTYHHHLVLTGLIRKDELIGKCHQRMFVKLVVMAPIHLYLMSRYRICIWVSTTFRCLPGSFINSYLNTRKIITRNDAVAGWLTAIHKVLMQTVDIYFQLY